METDDRAETSSNPSIGNRRQTGKAREVPFDSGDEPIQLGAPSGPDESQASSSRNAAQLPLPAFDEPFISRHLRQQEDADAEEMNPNVAGPSRSLGVRRVLKNTLSDAGALLFGRGPSSGSSSGRNTHSGPR